jgi:hypothetical protein
LRIERTVFRLRSMVPEQTTPPPPALTSLGSNPVADHGVVLTGVCDAMKKARIRWEEDEENREKEM